MRYVSTAGGESYPDDGGGFGTKYHEAIKAKELETPLSHPDYSKYIDRFEHNGYQVRLNYLGLDKISDCEVRVQASGATMSKFAYNKVKHDISKLESFRRQAFSKVLQ